MLLVAVTGGIGSGKTTVASALAERGAPEIDADLVARAVVEPGGAAYDGIVERFGRAVLRPDATIDRPALASIVFADRTALADLNGITHPVIGAEILGRLRSLDAHDGPVILDVPLLDATTLQLYRPAALVVVDTPEDLAVARLVAHRGFSESDARARIAAQASRDERRALLALVPAGLVIDNSGDRPGLDVEIERAWRWVSDLAAGQRGT